MLFAVLLDMLVANTVLVSLALVFLCVRPGRSGRRRSAVWQAVLGTLLVVPVMSAVGPRWALLDGRELELVSSTTASRSPVAPESRAFLACAWISGAVVVAGAHIVSAARLRRRLAAASVPAANRLVAVLADCSRRLGLARPPRLVVCRPAVPCTFGLLRPVVVLPSTAVDWPPEKLRAVLLHEVEHVRRRDRMLQLIAHAVQALYWFQPLAWHASHRYHVERENACDEAVLATGIRRSAYATVLIGVAREAGRLRGAATMVQRSDLRRRVVAVLGARTDRRPASIRQVLGVPSLCLLAAWVACATEARGDDTYWMDSRIEMPPGSTQLRLEMRRGARAEIRGSQRAGALVRARLFTRAAGPERAARILNRVLVRRGSTLETVGPAGSPWRVDYDIEVPSDLDLTITGEDPEIDIRHVAGNVNIRVEGGRAWLGGLEGRVNGYSRTGDIQAFLTGSAWRGPGLSLRSGSGTVGLTMAAEYSARLEAGTAQGDVTLELEDGQLTRVPGSFVLGAGGAPIEAFSESGGVHVRRHRGTNHTR